MCHALSSNNMPTDSDAHLEIGHVLFMDVVGYSKLLLDEQRELQQELTQIVRDTRQVRAAEAGGKLIRVPTGDGMALVFFNSPEEPVRCAIEITKTLKEHPQLKLRIGIHSGPVNQVRDVNDRINVAGAGINIAQRVMDCGDAGHILLSKRVAEDLAQSRKWRPYLHDLGECAVKHNVPIFVVNFYNDEVGNPELPEKFKQTPEEKAPAFGAVRPGLILRRWRVVIGAAVLLIAAFVLGIWLHSRNETAGGLDSEIRSGLAESLKAKIEAEVRSRVVEGLKGKAATLPPEKSIAVLPFENLSRDPDNAYFAEGMQDEILTRLAKIADLKVISRTSTQHFQSSPDNLPQIAKQLGVANILEGSVQKAGDQVRVNVQLINAASDAHLWAESYDRKLNDIFAVESEIAKTVADTLQAKLTGSEKRAISARPTDNPVAYQDYLKGRYFWNKRTGADLRMAIEYFNQALAKDPGYALAYAGLADSYGLLPFYGASSPADSHPQAKAAAKKALQLDETLAEAHNSLANVLDMYDFNFEQGRKEFERAIQLNPNYATAHEWYGELLAELGRFDEAIAESKRAQELDPLSLIVNADLGEVYTYARQYDKAIEQLRKTLEMDPRFYYAHWKLGIALQLKGQLRDAITEYRKAVELNDDPYALALLGQAYARAGQREEAQNILARLGQEAKSRYVHAYSFALMYLALGDKERAIDELERTYRERADVFSIKVDRMLDELRGNPRFEALVQKVFAPKKTESDSQQSSP
jgi:TolB-like protein/Flp pilus assembly protein TadD